MPIGSSSRVTKLPDLVIPNGDTFSNILNAWNMYGDAAGIFLYALATNAVGPFVIQVCNDTSATAASTWFSWATPDGDIVAPAAGKAGFFDGLVSAGSIRIAAASAVTGNQTFRVTKHATI
jgi:hypothetical protein